SQTGSLQTPMLHGPLMQSSSTRQVPPSRQVSRHEPPQSMSVSSPSCMPLKQLGGTSPSPSPSPPSSPSPSPSPDDIVSPVSASLPSALPTSASMPSAMLSSAVPPASWALGHDFCPSPSSRQGS